MVAEMILHTGKEKEDSGRQLNGRKKFNGAGE